MTHPKTIKTCVDCGTPVSYRSARCMSCHIKAVHKQRRETARPILANDTDPSGATLLVPLTRGKHALIDANDIDLIRPHLWVARYDRCGTWYAITTLRHTDGTRRTLSMHRCVFGDAAERIDHRNRDGLDNRRCNLRAASYGQNRANSVSTARSGFKGVYASRNGKWEARIRHAGSVTQIGTFATAVEAARAYDAAARTIHGEFARCNFTDDCSFELAS